MSCDEPQRANLWQKVGRKKVEREPARPPPWRSLPVYLRGRLEAGVLLPDFTIVPGSKFDPEAYADEKELRKMDITIKAQLAEGRTMFYKSPGNSMWPWFNRANIKSKHGFKQIQSLARRRERVTLGPDHHAWPAGISAP